MVRKRRCMTGGALYVYSLPRKHNKGTLVAAISSAIRKANCGSVLASGRSFIDDMITVEIGALDCEEANDVVITACEKLRCSDYELVWDETRFILC